MAHRIELEIRGDHVCWKVRGLSGGGTVRFDDNDPRVRYHLRSLIHALQIATQRAQPIQSYFKERRSVPDATPVLCPECAGAFPHECGLCDGEGVVTAKRAAAWEAAQRRD